MAARISAGLKFARGDRVRLEYLPGRGTVQVAGPEQSEVLWDGSRRGDVRVHPNKHLIRLLERKRSSRA